MSFAPCQRSAIAPGRSLCRGALMLAKHTRIRVFAVACVRRFAHPRRVNLDRSKPVWPQVATELRRRIDAGIYAPGSRMPAVNDVAAELDVAASTVQKAYAALREDGLLRTVLGAGSYVSETR